MVGARVRRQQVAYARRRGLSNRRACAVLSVSRSTLGYVSRLRQRDAPALAVMRKLASQYPRYGYRKIRFFLARRGHPMSAQRASFSSNQWSEETGQVNVLWQDACELRILRLDIPHGLVDGLADVRSFRQP